MISRKNILIQFYRISQFQCLVFEINQTTTDNILKMYMMNRRNLSPNLKPYSSCLVSNKSSESDFHTPLALNDLHEIFVFDHNKY